MEQRTVRVSILKHRETDLLTTRSEEMPGLMLHARSEAEIVEWLVPTIREMFERDGFSVADVDLVRDTQREVAHFWPSFFVANVSLLRSDSQTGDARRVHKSPKRDPVGAGS
jgi:hypothetical protein